MLTRNGSFDFAEDDAHCFKGPGTLGIEHLARYRGRSVTEIRVFSGVGGGGMRHGSGS